MEYDFIIVYKLSKNHVVANVLSKLRDVIEPSRVLEQTTNASLFFIELEWLNDVRMFCYIEQMEESLSTRKK
jgi:hypothetical protein